jgi:hypothetical protein
MSLVIKPFYLLRHEDSSGISGVGIVAVGVIYPNGKAHIQWTSYRSSFEQHDSIESLMDIHGHAGKTEVVYGPPYDPAAKVKKPRKKKSNGQD